MNFSFYMFVVFNLFIYLMIIVISNIILVRKNKKTFLNFFREYYEILIIELVMFKYIDIVRSVAVSFDRDWLEVLKLCILKIVVFILL